MINNKNRAILTAEQVLAIRDTIQGRKWLERKRKQLRAEIADLNRAINETKLESIAKKHGVSRGAIASITSGKNWKDI